MTNIFKSLNALLFPPVTIHYQNSKVYIPVLNGLRGLAILLVILFHTFHFMFGWCGVDLFFVLSGFLITGSLLETKTQTHYFRDFWIKRTLRILPLYYLVLIIILIPKDVFGIDTVSYTSWTYWFYLQNWQYVINGVFPDGKDTLNHFWSLAVEEQFYLLFPFIIRYTSKKALLNILLFFIVIAICFRYYYFSIENIGYYVATISRMDSLSIGALLAYLTRHYKVFLEKWVHAFFYTSLLYIAIIIAITHDMHFSNPYFANLGLTIFALFFASLLVYSLSTFKNNFIAYFLNNSILKFLGKIAYGIYVYHWLLYVFIKPSMEKMVFNTIHHSLLSKIIVSVFVFLSTILLSYLSYHFFEKRIMNLKRKLIVE